jgi:hypothetical protein
MHQGTRDGGALQQTPAQPARQFRAMLAETGCFECRCCGFEGLIESVKAGSKCQIFEEGEIIVEQRLVRQQSYSAAAWIRPPLEGAPQQPNLSGCGPQ